MSITLVDEDIARILNVSLGGWYHYFEFEGHPLGKIAFALAITRKFVRNRNLSQHRCLLK